MKKTLIKLAVGVFLTALSFMKTEAACAPSPTIVSILPSNSATVGLCAGTIVTISGNFTGTFSGANPYKAVLIMGGSPVSTISGITTSGFKFFYTVPNDGQTGKTVQIQIPKYGFYTCNGNSVGGNAIGQDYSLGTSYLTSPSSSCFDGIGIDMGLDNTDAQPNIIYSLYRSSSFLKTLTCTGMGDPIDFGVQSIVGVYSILGLNTVTGCTRLEGDPVVASSQQYVINEVPGAPIGLVYTWCGSSGDLSLIGHSTTPGVAYTWSNGGTPVPVNPGDFYVVGAPVSSGVTYTVTGTLGICSSSSTITPTYRSIPNATLSVLNSTAAGRVCLPSETYVPYNITLTGGTGTLTANIMRNGSYYTTYSNVDGVYLVNYLMHTTTGTFIYSGTVSDEGHCTTNINSPLLTITAVNGPTLTITQTANCPTCSPQYISYTANGTWYYPNDGLWGSGGVYSTNSAQTFYYNIHATESWPVITVSNGCTVVGFAGVPCATGCYTARIGVDDSTSQNTNIYPNPASSEINIIAPFDNYTLVINNLLGSEVLSKQVKNKEIQIDVSSIPAGLYTIHLWNQDGQVVKKLELTR